MLTAEKDMKMTSQEESRGSDEPSIWCIMTRLDGLATEILHQ